MAYDAWLQGFEVGVVEETTPPDDSSSSSNSSSNTSDSSSSSVLNPSDKPTDSCFGSVSGCGLSILVAFAVAVLYKKKRA